MSESSNNNTDAVSRIAGGIFNVGAAGVVCWLVVSEIPALRTQTQTQHLAVMEAQGKTSNMLHELANEIRELRRERAVATGAKSEK